MVAKNEYHEVVFTDMTHDARGVCKIDGYPLFVKNALKGETALVKITKKNKHFGLARLVELRKVSPFRMQPICEHYDVCGGCSIMHMNYEMQLDFKRYRTVETLRKLGKIECSVSPCVGMSNPYAYRNKVTVFFKYRNGRLMTGMYKRESHDVVDIKRCHIIPKIHNDIIRFLKAEIEDMNIEIYDDDTGAGVLRGVMIRSSATDGQLQVTLITSRTRFNEKEALAERLMERFPNLVGVIQNINAGPNISILGQKSRTLIGQETFSDTMLGCRFDISHRAFHQINPLQSVALFNHAVALAGLKVSDTVLDAYCGIGTIALCVASRVKAVIGVDIVKESIKNAVANARMNHIKNAKFIHGAVEDVMTTLKNETIDVVFVDPPRKGCDKAFLQTLIELGIPKIIYISCNVSTFARDLNCLQAGGYRVGNVTPFDMFPHTSHIECVSLLVRDGESERTETSE